MAPRNPINKYYNGTPREVGERILLSLPAPSLSLLSPSLPLSLSLSLSILLFLSATAVEKGSVLRLCSHSRRVPRPRSPRPRLRPRNFALLSLSLTLSVPLFRLSLTRSFSRSLARFFLRVALLFFSLSLSLSLSLRPSLHGPSALFARFLALSLVPSSFLSPHRLPFGPPSPVSPLIQRRLHFTFLVAN